MSTMLGHPNGQSVPGRYVESLLPSFLSGASTPIISVANFSERTFENAGRPEAFSDMLIQSMLSSSRAADEASERASMVSGVTFVLPTVEPKRWKKYQVLRVRSELRGRKVHTTVALTDDISAERLQDMTHGGSFVETRSEVSESDVMTLALNPVDLPPSISHADDIAMDGDGQPLGRLTDEEAAMEIFRRQLKEPERLASRLLQKIREDPPQDFQPFSEVLEELPGLLQGHQVVDRYEGLAAEVEQKRVVEGEPAIIIPVTPE
jgi:hypothetical protein